MQLALSHLGYLPTSPKQVTLCPENDSDSLPDRIPFFLRQNCFRMPRDRPDPAGFSTRFPCPFDLMEGTLIPEPGTFFYQGELVRCESRWGAYWQADFSEFTECGSFQIETDYQISPPFMIADWIYDRPVRSFLTFLNSQRCGCEIPGVHPACHLDDGMLDTDNSYWPATGGWHDAGDFRKWLAFTMGNLEALVSICLRGHSGFYQSAHDEIRWGNRLFHQMITSEGQVYEDVAGGGAPPDMERTYEEHWWFENHPGCYGGANDNRWTDNRLRSGDERLVRTTYNPQVQLAFVQFQMLCSQTLPEGGTVCRDLAERAWAYACDRGHDGRTLFLAQELLAALELPERAEIEHIRSLVNELIDRQETREIGITGFFYEKNRIDAYRSIAFAGLPSEALLRLIELDIPALSAESDKCREAVTRYCSGYLAADAQSNPFGLTPYGVFKDPEHPDRQTFRDAGGGLGIRTFIHPFNWQGIVHGTSSVAAAHAAVLAKAAALLDVNEWRLLAEKQLQWMLGNNPLNRSLYTGIGYRQPIGYGFRVTQIPEATVAGFIGRPDDSPYLEESFAIEWSTLEFWDMPYVHAIKAMSWLKS